jgi:signal transduction histidine kinase
MTIDRKNLFSNKRIRRILILVLVAFFLIIGLLSFLFYKFTLNNFVKSELMKLQGISNSIALQINGDVHDDLMMKYKFIDGIKNNNEDTTYLNLHNLLKRNHDANMLKSPIYTLVKSMDNKAYEFGITSNAEPYYRHKYTSFPISLFEQYNTGGTIEPYQDEFGTWLSAFSPVKNSEGKNIAIVMVDEKLSNFLAISRRQLIEALLIAISLFTLMYFLLMYILREILKRENDDKNLLAESNATNEKMTIDLEKAYIQLSNISELRKEMIANVSHDLRTPLSNILGYMEIIRDRDDLSEQEKSNYLGIAYKEADRMKSMVSDLFELSKLEAGQIVLEKETFNISELIHDVAQKYTLQLKAKHIELKFDINENVGLVNGDIKYIERVFQNLLDNAVKYVYEGGFILLSVIDAGNKVKVKVCNNGDPIEEEDRKHVFERYYKNSSEKGSTGLGLAISKKIMDLHENAINVEVNGNINSFWFGIDK